MVFHKLKYSFEIIEGHIIHIKHFLTDRTEECWNIYLENIFWGGKITFPMSVEKEALDRILWMYDLKEEEFEQTGEFHAKGPSTGVVCIYTNRKKDEIYFIMFTNRQQMYKKFIHYSHKKEYVSLKEHSFVIRFKGCVYSDKWKDFHVEKAELVIDRHHRYKIDQNLCHRKEYILFEQKIPLESFVSPEMEINNPIHMEIWVDGEILEFNVGHKSKRKKPSKYYYVPITAVYYKDKAIFVRGNVNQNYTLVVRDKDIVEYNEDFLKLESPWKSKQMYYSGKWKRRLHKKPINLYYEKNAMKAEEGTFEIFEKALESPDSENFFILDQASSQWEELSKHRNVVRKYSEEYYRLLYNADCFISTETPSHLNVHRAINKYVRKTLLEKKFVFLQHGVTYLKCQGTGSVFGKGKEGEPDYIIVGSEKEAKAVAGMLRISRERCISAGLPIFSTIKYEHINEFSGDIVTIMMTWKPSEEHMLNHFEDSGYYQNVRTVYEMIQKYIPIQQIQIVPHPKVLKLLMQTDLAKVVWNKSVSDALKNTKLLITDYSSVCYNVFYQGAAVVFYQPDLDDYQKEVGKLVLKDEEYIGYRVYNQDQLETCIQKGIHQGCIDLKYMRSDEFVARYRTINQFSDGKNIQRILEFLAKEKIV